STPFKLSLLVLHHYVGFYFPALTCLKCDRVNTSGVCQSGASFCQTKGSQQCYVRKVYEDDTISYGSQGCSSICTDMLLFSPNVAVDLKCCDDSPLCNKF
uniref:UPAR/Ly6 domain-containing protein n=1 Tax=Equus asinus asinus TaxID=83772 RepID=A0A8C4L1M0_EQUAS